MSTQNNRGLFGSPVSLECQDHLFKLRGLVVALELLTSADPNTYFPDAAGALRVLALEQIEALHGKLWPPPDETFTDCNGIVRPAFSDTKPEAAS